jgi:hypothetical protein
MAGSPLSARDATDSQKVLVLCDGTNIMKREIVSCSSSRELWERGLRPTDHATQSQALFEATWP